MTWEYYYILTVVFLLAATHSWFPWCCCDDQPTPNSLCIYCLDLGLAGGENTADFVVEISGMANVAGTASGQCSSCEDYDGSYIVVNIGVTGMGYCEWDWTTTSSTKCGEDQTAVVVRYGPFALPRTFEAILSQRIGTYYNYYYWGVAQAVNMKCMEVDRSLPYVSSNIHFALTNLECDASSATCDIATYG